MAYTNLLIGGFAVKSNLVLQFGGREADEAAFVKRAQEDWKNAGKKASEIKELSLYVQPENSKVYYVINNDFKGDFDI